MLIQLTYASRVARSLGPADVKDIIAASGRNNGRLGVSGALCLHNGIFLQMLEGDRTAVSTLYQHILRDPRHKDAAILDFSEIPRRRFTRWAMGLLAATEDNRELFMRHCASPVFDPYAMPAASLRGLFDEVVDNARWLN